MDVTYRNERGKALQRSCLYRPCLLLLAPHVWIRGRLAEVWADGMTVKAIEITCEVYGAYSVVELFRMPASACPQVLQTAASRHTHYRGLRAELRIASPVRGEGQSIHTGSEGNQGTIFVTVSWKT